ncbi:MAG: hypothetical protein CL573_08450 [Alphaproteobacteria bacterium]|nr:hypothetical protein [Alphaproteobacteria bacterium]
MFGFSLTKLLILALIIGAVIVGFRIFGRLTSAGEQAPVGDKSAAAAFETEYDKETDTYVVRNDRTKQD